jgi:hypothetical protein
MCKSLAHPKLFAAGGSVHSMAPKKNYRCTCTEHCHGGKDVGRTTWYEHAPHRIHIPPFIPPNTSVTASTSNPDNSGASEDEEDEDEGQRPRKRQCAVSTSDSDKPEAHEEQGAGALEGGRTAGEGD